MTTKYRFSKIEKHKRGDKKPRRTKGNRGWRRLITIVNDYKKKISLVRYIIIINISLVT